MSSEVETKGDSFQWLGPDVTIKILSYLDHPRDLVRVSAVSSSWYRFVVENDLCIQLCLKMVPEISDVVHSIEVDNMSEPDVLGKSMNWEHLKRNHKVFAFLAFKLTPMMKTKSCISKAITPFNSNDYPDESIQNALEPGHRPENSIHNTLEHGDRTQNRASYWLSEGQSHPAVPETLVYERYSKVCLFTEVHVQPFEGSPIYSARAVRFKIGHPRYPVGLENAIADGMARDYMVGDAQFKWTFKSPLFPMSRAYLLANLKPLLLILENKVRFILGIVNGEIILSNRKIADLLMELKQKGFTPMPRKGKSAEPKVAGPNDNNKEQEGGCGDYEYLLSLPIRTFTYESIQKLIAEKDEKKKEYDILKATPTTSLWMTDLDELEKKLDEIDSREAKEERKNEVKPSR